MTGPANAPEWLKPGDVIALYGVHPDTPGRWARAGRIDTVRTPGGQYRYCAAQIAAQRGQTLGQLAADIQALKRGAS